MEISRVKAIQKAQKKTDTLINDLELLRDASKYVMMNTGEDVGVVAQIVGAIRHLRQSSYALLLAEASAESEEITGQMKADLDALERADEG